MIEKRGELEKDEGSGHIQARKINLAIHLIGNSPLQSDWVDKTPSSLAGVGDRVCAESNDSFTSRIAAPEALRLKLMSESGEMHDYILQASN